MSILVLKYYLKIAINFTKESFGTVLFFVSLFLLSSTFGLNRFYEVFCSKVKNMEWGSYLFIILFGVLIIIALGIFKRILSVDSLFLQNHLKVWRVNRAKRNHIILIGAMLSALLLGLYFIKFGFSLIVVVAFFSSLLISIIYSQTIKSFDPLVKSTSDKKNNLTFFKRSNHSHLRFKAVFSLLLTSLFREIDKSKLTQSALSLMALILFNWYSTVVMTNNELATTWPYLLPLLILLPVFVESNSIILRDLSYYNRAISWSEYFASSSLSILCFSILYILNFLSIYFLFSIEISNFLMAYPLFIVAICYIEFLKVSTLDSRILRWLLIISSIILPILIPLFIFLRVKGLCHD